MAQRIRLVLLTVVLVGLGGLATFTASSSSAASDLCAPAATLLDNKKADAALVYIEQLRAPAITLIDAGLVSREIIDTSTACEDLRVQALAKASELSVLDGTEKWGKAWADFTKSTLGPLFPIGLGVLAVLVGLLILARLFVLLPRSPFFRLRPKSGWLFLWIGLTSVVVASVWIPVMPLLPTSDLTASGLTQIASLGSAILVGIFGALSLSIFLSGRLRLSIEVRDEKGTANPTAAAEVVAYLAELGATRPQDIEVPTTLDVDSLKSSVVSGLPGSDVLASLLAALENIFGLVPWRVTIADNDSLTSSVVITRNGRSITGRIVDLSQEQLLKASPPEGVADPRPRYLRKLAAAVVLTTLASHYKFSGMHGATDSRSIGLYYLAKSEFPENDIVAGFLLEEALEVDPNNFVAQFAAQSIADRQRVEVVELEIFALWLQSQLQESPYIRIVKNVETPAMRLRMQVLTTYIFIARNLDAAHNSTDNAEMEIRNRVVLRAVDYAYDSVQNLEKVRAPQDVFYAKVRMVASVNLRAISDSLAESERKIQATVDARKPAEAAPVSKATNQPKLSAGENARKQAAIEADPNQAELDAKTLKKFLDAKNKLKPSLVSSEKWFAAALISRSRTVAYGVLCYLVRFPNGANLQNEFTRRRFVFRGKDGGLRAWAKNDPELESVRKQGWFTKAIAAPPFKKSRAATPET